MSLNICQAEIPIDDARGRTDGRSNRLVRKDGGHFKIIYETLFTLQQCSTLGA